MARKPSSRPSRRGRPASKGGRDYSAEYARRKAQGLAAGKTVQQARGHKEREHIERRRREVERAQGTTYERRQTRELADHQARRNKNLDRDDARTFFERILRTRGYAAIKEIKARLAGLKEHRAKRIRRNGKLITIDFGAADRAHNAMRALAEEYGTGEDDWDYFFYN